MFPIKIDTLERSVALSAHAHREVSRECFHEIAETWQKQMLPLRFTAQSPRYPHQPRTKKYLAQKQKLYERGRAKAPNIVNVLTGNMGEVLTRVGIVHAYPTRAVVSKVGTRYIEMKPNKSNQPDKWAEVSYLLKREQEQLARQFGATYTRLAAAHTETKRHTSG